MERLVFSKVSHISFLFMMLGITLQKVTEIVNIKRKKKEISHVIKYSSTFKTISQDITLGFQHSYKPPKRPIGLKK